VTPVPGPAPVTSPTPAAPVATIARAGRGALRFTHLRRRSMASVRPDHRIERLREVPLAPNRVTTVDVACRAGEKAVHGQYAIAYDTPRPPSQKRHVDTFTMGRRVYAVRVKVGNVAARTVWVQARVVCQ
jgi:hypothetical protein